MLLYIHIPFCDSKCFYCAFNSYTSLHSLRDEYMIALNKQLKHDLEKHNQKVETIFIGGGTPSTIKAHKSTLVVVSCFESLFCSTIKFCSILVQCFSCFDTCQNMHPPMSTATCPQHGFCKLCWGVEFGIRPPYCHYQSFPAMTELRTNLFAQTDGQFASLLPTKMTSIPQAPPTQADSPLGKCA